MASPQAEATFAAFREIRAATGGATPSLEEVRAGGEMFGEMTAEPAGVSYEAVDVDGIPAMWITPPTTTNGVLLYLHGGGYMACSVNSHKRMIGHIAAAVGARALAIDYRRTPEAVHPAQVDDAVTAYRWLLRSGHAPDRVALAGDSAGGHLVLTTLLRLRADGDPLPAAAVLLSPWVDLEATGESVTSRADVDLLITAEGGKLAAEALLGGGDPRDPTVAPLHADLSGLPPVYIQVGDHEVLLDDSTRVADRIRAAGGAVDLEVFPEMQHVFQVCAGNVPEADDAIARIGAWLAPRLGTATAVNVARVRRWAWTWNHDVMRMVDECYAEDCEVIDVVRDRVINGREGLRAIERQMADVDPTRRMVITKVVADERTAVVEVESFWRGDSVVARGCVVLTFGDDGLIVSDHTYSADPIGAAD